MRYSGVIFTNVSVPDDQCPEPEVERTFTRKGKAGYQAFIAAETKAKPRRKAKKMGKEKPPSRKAKPARNT